ncbi:MAG: peptidylprolyl isomerase [Desulfatiglandaceae bacterium]|jgi:FKBP-type peptidyl-prolyl cis-trans isomerase 2
MKKANKGNQVKVHYTGKLEDGSILDSSRSQGPLEFTIGAGQVIPGFEKCVVGMEVGDKQTFEIPQAFGVRRQELVVCADKNDFPEALEPDIGQGVQLNDGTGNTIDAVVKDIEGDTVTLDANHPLAGKTIVFDIELIAVA